jgi:hypothetical protein
MGLVVVNLAGCMKRHAPAQPSNPQATATLIGTALTETLGAAKAYPDIAAQHVDAALEVLRSCQGQQLGEYQATYAELLTGCTQLKGMVDRSAAPAEVRAKIDELLPLVAKLPRVKPPQESPGG